RFIRNSPVKPGLPDLRPLSHEIIRLLFLKRGERMAADPKHIKVTEESHLADILREARERPVVLEDNGEHYRLDHMKKEPKDDIWEGYNPKKVRAAIEKYAGTIT